MQSVTREVSSCSPSFTEDGIETSIANSNSHSTRQHQSAANTLINSSSSSSSNNNNNTNSNYYNTTDLAFSSDRLAHMLEQLSRIPNESTIAIPWPVWIVLGDTSSGKSTVLSQLTGIPLPSSHELTTRCPISLSIRPARNGSLRVCHL
jgi:Dynamin family